MSGRRSAKSAGKKSVTLTDMFTVRKSKRGRVEKAAIEEDPAALQVNKKKKQQQQQPQQPLKEAEEQPQEQQPEVVVEEDLAAKQRETIDALRYRKRLGAQERLDRSADKLPYAIFETVHYEPRGVSEDSLQTQYGRSPRAVFNENVHQCKAFEYVAEHYVIPKDFDASLKYGARSGMCHEERVVGAFEQGLLAPKDPTAAQIKLCRTCGETGHWGWECPSLLSQ